MEQSIVSNLICSPAYIWQRLHLLPPIDSDNCELKVLVISFFERNQHLEQVQRA